MKERTQVYGTVQLYDDRKAPLNEFREYSGFIVRDFEDGSYLVNERGTELLIETYFEDTIITVEESE